jgi:molybdopterin-containing oxidoreductase family iron-sulfur binding subunit
LLPCSAACGSDCITFGNLKDPNSAVAKKFESERAYAMLSELNTKPGVRYLARISHSETDHGHGGGH